MGNSSYKGFESAAERSKRLGGSAIVIFRSPKASSGTSSKWSAPKQGSPDAVRRRWEARLVREKGQEWVDQHRGLLDDQWRQALNLGLVAKPVFQEAQSPQ